VRRGEDAMSNATHLAKHATRSAEPVQHHDTIAPPVDVYENADELLVVADVPGASHDGIDVQLEKGQLTILARRGGESTGTPLATEYRSRDYFRVFSVPQGIDASKIGAQFTAGVLHLHLPKSESLKPRRIEVKQG
jgi:HSP20 family molecular chaperone IbpA